ncbi:MAG: hypothetical protein FWD05_11370 [Oscillospiraceae bacterium]|nr:hypothetical protein [Oscillospiraceae bacterium]
MGNYIVKCDCFIHSLKKNSVHILDEATIIEKIGENEYVADYKGVKCTAQFNHIVGRYYIDDLYGVIHDKQPLEQCR